MRKAKTIKARLRPDGLLLLLALLQPFLPLSATTLLRLELEALVAQSELIFVGSVLDVETGLDNEQVYTTVLFQLDELVVGDYTDSTLSLRFLGGRTPQVELEVAGQFIPQAGLRGLWFVADSDSPMVNPLTGWSQGYMPVLENGGSRYLDLRGHPDYANALGVQPPLADKMRALGFDAAQVNERFPDSLEFPLADFIALLRYLANGGD